MPGLHFNGIASVHKQKQQQFTHAKEYGDDPKQLCREFHDMLLFEISHAYSVGFQRESASRDATTHKPGCFPGLPLANRPFLVDPPALRHRGQHMHTHLACSPQLWYTPYCITTQTVLRKRQVLSCEIVGSGTIPSVRPREYVVMKVVACKKSVRLPRNLRL